MPRQIMLRSPSSNRRQPLIQAQPSPKKARFAEVAGGATADCAAVCCCCPCTVVNLVVLAVYTLPASLCKRILRKRKRLLMNKKGTSSQRRRRCSADSDDTDVYLHPGTVVSLQDVNMLVKADPAPDKEVMELDMEMLDRFYNTGFWRSPSQREE